MVPDSDPPPLGPQTAMTSLMRPPEHGHHLSLSEWGSSLSKEGFTECDAKTIAARRKRSEIRRLKLRVAAHEELAEPLLKRRKVVSKEMVVPSQDSALTFGMLRGCEPDDMTGTCKPITDAGTENVATDTCAPPEPCANQDQDGGLELRCRLPFSGADAACPSHCIVSICGRSRFMEDAAIAVPSFLTMPSSVVGHGGSAHLETFNFYGVYDGHGGAQAANFCKERMHGWLAEEMSASANTSPSHLEACLQTCFKRIDDELCGVCLHGSECPRKVDAGSTNSRSSCREPLVPGSVGTTAAVAVVGAHHIVVGNCGDSRAVLCRAGEAVTLSVDHKANRPDEIARIEAAGGQVFTWQGHRVCGVLAMSRALGDGFLKPYVIGQPEVMITERTDDDECLILATDGLWDVLSSKYVCKVARKAMANWRREHTSFQHRYPLFAHHSEEQQQACNDMDADVEDSPAQVVAAMLVKLALAKNSKDNISVVVVDLKRL